MKLDADYYLCAVEHITTCADTDKSVRGQQGNRVWVCLVT